MSYYNQQPPAGYPRPPPQGVPGQPAGPVKEPKRCLFEFSCLCSVTIAFQSELKDHYFKCERMKLHDQDLFNIIVRHNHKDLEVRQKQSLSAVIDMFSNEIHNSIAMR